MVRGAARYGGEEGRVERTKRGARPSHRLARPSTRKPRKAASNSHGEFRAIHLLASLINDEQSLVVPMLIKSNIDVEGLDKEIQRVVVDGGMLLKGL